MRQGSLCLLEWPCSLSDTFARRSTSLFSFTAAQHPPHFAANWRKASYLFSYFLNQLLDDADHDLGRHTGHPVDYLLARQLLLPLNREKANLG